MNRLSLLSTALFLLAASPRAAAAPAAPAIPTSECAGTSPHLVVVTDSRTLRLCDRGRAVSTYGVRLARHGAGKRAEGDAKVPLGRYPLGSPRRSDTFGLFIPIEYPTPAQRKKGFTGGSVGVHGPHRQAAWLGRLVNVFNTTDGCVGLATDEEMKAIAAWVRAHHPAFIELRVEDPPPPPPRARPVR